MERSHLKTWAAYPSIDESADTALHRDISVTAGYYRRLRLFLSIVFALFARKYGRNVAALTFTGNLQ